MTWGRSITEQRERRQVDRERNLAGLLAKSPHVQRGVYASAGNFEPQPKHDYIRSEALMKAYREIPCQNCGRSDGTVCGAHSNQLIHGKGRGIKADDHRCAALCFTCHGVLDQGSELSEAERVTLWHCAHVRTVRELLARKLWPVDVPVPSLEVRA